MELLNYQKIKNQKLFNLWFQKNVISNVVERNDKFMHIILFLQCSESLFNDGMLKKGKHFVIF
jgi:hypothetical protein